MFKKVLKFSFVLALFAVILSACSLPKLKSISQEKAAGDENKNEILEEEDESGLASTKRLMKFSDAEDLKRFLKENSFNKTLAPVTENQAKSLAVGADIYLEKKDEGGIFQVDEKYAYVLLRDELKIAKANFSDSEEILSSIKFPSRPQGFLLSGTKLIVFGSDQKITEKADYKIFRRLNAYTFLQIFDLADISQPKLISDLSAEGDYAGIRLIDDYVYLLTSGDSSYVEGEILTPRIFKEGELLAGNCSSDAACFAPDVYYFDIPYDNLKFVNTAIINLNDVNKPLKGQAYLLDSKQLLYLSSSNIFITYAEQVDENILEQAVKKEIILPKLSAAEKEKVEAINRTPSYILTSGEKKIKINNLLDLYLSSLSASEYETINGEINSALKEEMSLQAVSLEKTFIYKIGIRGEKLDYRGVGEVGGRVLGESSLNENDSYLRVVTKRSDLWAKLSGHDKKSYSNVYILNNELKLISRLENLGVDEAITAARFIGDRLYLLTSQVGEPLYVVDLTDALKPTVLGAIKLPAYANNLYKADVAGSRLFSLGRDSENGNNGLKLSYFDFSDLKTPKELDSYIIGDASSDSIALSDKGSLFYSSSKNILSVPAVLRSGGEIVFAGALNFQVKDDQLVLKGQVDHAIKGQASASDFWNSYNYYDNTVKRALFSGNNFYTFSNLFLKANNLTDFSPLGTLAFTSEAAGSLPSSEEILEEEPGEEIKSGEDNPSSELTEGNTAEPVSEESAPSETDSGTETKPVPIDEENTEEADTSIE